MDLESGKRTLVNYIKKSQYFLIILVAGVLLMIFPDTGRQQPEPVLAEAAVPKDLEMRLSEILSQISGVGRAEVLLTEEYGLETIYQTDTGQNSSDKDTVILTDSSRAQYGLVKQIRPPGYRGAVVVCKGADRASVRLAVVEAVMRATGLSSDCITVLKMK